LPCTSTTSWTQLLLVVEGLEPVRGVEPEQPLPPRQLLAGGEEAAEREDAEGCRDPSAEPQCTATGEEERRHIRRDLSHSSIESSRTSASYSGRTSAVSPSKAAPASGIAKRVADRLLDSPQN
jgi:hypothetical protein